jgi:hypothetical protein
MRQLFLFVLILLLISTGCTNQYKVPRDILPKEKMEKVLWDMILADRYSTIVLSKDSTKNLKQETFTMYEQVFSIHKITHQQFVKSLKYYLERPDISQVMLDSLATKANRRREEMYRPSAPSPQ